MERDKYPPRQQQEPIGGTFEILRMERSCLVSAGPDGTQAQLQCRLNLSQASLGPRKVRTKQGSQEICWVSPASLPMFLNGGPRSRDATDGLSSPFPCVISPGSAHLGKTWWSTSVRDSRPSRCKPARSISSRKTRTFSGMRCCWRRKVLSVRSGKSKRGMLRTGTKAAFESGDVCGRHERTVEICTWGPRPQHGACYSSWLSITGSIEEG